MRNGMNPNMQSGNPMQFLQMLMQNPAQILSRSGLDVPGNLHDPTAIIQHLMNSGQITQAQYDQARQIASRFKK